MQDTSIQVKNHPQAAIEGATPKLEASATLKLGSFGLKLGLEAYFAFIFAH